MEFLISLNMRNVYHIDYSFPDYNKEKDNNLMNILILKKILTYSTIVIKFNF